MFENLKSGMLVRLDSKFVQLMVWVVGLGWWFGILGVHPSNNPFHKGIPNIQTNS